MADPATGEPMEAGVHTRVGSVTKTFTGTLVLQPAEEGKLFLHDRIAQYAPGIPNGKEITPRRLMNMTSGIAGYTSSTQFTDRYFSVPETVFTRRS